MINLYGIHGNSYEILLDDDQLIIRSLDDDGSESLVFYNSATNDYIVCARYYDKDNNMFYMPVVVDNTSIELREFHYQVAKKMALL